MKFIFLFKRLLLAILISGVGPVATATDLDTGVLRDMAPRPVTVLENRHFHKALRPEIGVIAGSMLNEAYTNTKTYGVRAGLFIKEWLGVEGQVISTSISDTDDREALDMRKYRDLDDPDQLVTPEPVVNPISGITDVTGIIAPFYGKLNLLDKHIIYSDLYLTAGVSQVTTDQGDHTSFTFGAGQRFYFSKSWSVRVDFKDRVFTEQRNGKDSTKNAYSFDLGASFFFM